MDILLIIKAVGALSLALAVGGASLFLTFSKSAYLATAGGALVFFLLLGVLAIGQALIHGGQLSGIHLSLKSGSLAEGGGSGGVKLNQTHRTPVMHHWHE